MNIQKIDHETLMARKPSLASLKEDPRFPITVALDNIRSAYNVGSIFRTAEAIRAEKIILGGYTATPPHKEISKTALGAEAIVPFEHAKNLPATLRQLKQNGFHIAALELTHESIDFTQAKLPYPLCIVVGNEISGVSDEVMKEIDSAIDIPMFGRANSLNVAVATGIALFQMCRHYTNQENPYRIQQ